MFFLISIAQNMVHILKDAMILSIGGGYTAVPILKLIAIIFTLLFSYIYNILSNKYSIQTLFSYFMAISLILLYIFSFILMNNFINIDRSSYSRDETILIMWPISAFYIISDFWIGASGSLFFWKMLNTSFNHEQAEDNYSFFIATGNLGMISSGFISYIFANHIKEGLAVIKNISLIILFAISVTIYLIYIVEKYYLKFMRKTHMQHKNSIPKKNISTLDSIYYVFSSKYLVKMFIIIISISVIQVISDNPFKKFIEEEFLNICDQIGFFSILNICMGLLAIIINIHSKKLFLKFGWITSAIISPIAICIISVALSIALYFKAYLYHSVITYLGVSQFIISKGLKFSLFMFTFEMLFIPLNLEMQKKGKIAISLLASRLGKTLGSTILITIQYYSSFLILNSIIIIILSIIWGYTIINIYDQYKALIKQEDEESIHR